MSNTLKMRACLGILLLAVVAASPIMHIGRYTARGKEQRTCWKERDTKTMLCICNIGYLEPLIGYFNPSYDDRAPVWFNITGILSAAQSTRTGYPVAWIADWGNNSSITSWNGRWNFGMDTITARWTVYTPLGTWIAGNSIFGRTVIADNPCGPL